MTKTNIIRYVGILAVTTLGAAITSPDAEAQQVDERTAECLDAHQAAQELRIVGKLISARERASFCSQERCPNAVRSGCTKWLAELVDAQPSIAITARGQGGKDVSDVRVSIDGQVVAESLTGRAIDLDPGKHVVRFVHRTFAPQDKELVISEGVKSRPISIQFGAPSVPAGGAETSAVPRPEKPSSVGPMVLGVTGVAALGAFATLAALGSTELEDMRQSCGVTHSCPEGRIDQARTQLIVGDVFLGTGVVAIGVAIAWYVAGRSGDSAAEAPLRVSVNPTATGASTILGGSF